MPAPCIVNGNKGTGVQHKTMMTGLVAGALTALWPTTAAWADAAKPAALVSDGIPPIPDALVSDTRPYMEFRTAGFSGWNPIDRSMLVSTRFASTAQLHRIAAPMMAREQISFEAEPVRGSWSPTGDTLLVTKDSGGNEFFQLYTLKNGRLTLLTDGKSRNQFSSWNRHGTLIGYSSTRRNGADSDLYVMDPRDPKTDRLVAQVTGGGWAIRDFAPDGATALISESVSATKTNLHLLDLGTGKMTPIGDHAKPISYGDASFAGDGTLWVTSDEGSDFRRLGTIDTNTGRFTARSPEQKWDIGGFDIAPDDSFIAYTVNEAGITRVRVMDRKTGAVRTVEGLPAGGASALEIAPWGTIGLTATAYNSAADAYAIDPKTLAVTRWTKSETGGLDSDANVREQFIEVKSFDGEAVSGFLYRPDARQFPGKRPLIVNIHGGPEGQSTAGFLGRNNYLINDLGIAIFYPNVRGSTGFGKRFVSLDDGPFKREDSVKDIGAYLDYFDQDPGVDRTRIAVTGGSYGGYMCYAVAIRYGARLRGANCSVAISNFVTFLEHTESYRRDLRRVEYGDERIPAQRAKLTEISPLTSVAKLRIPLMVVTGGNDPRVPPSEAAQVIKAVRDNGGTVWSLLGQNEGHGFAKKENVDYNFWASLLFWKTNLLGEPMGMVAAAGGD